MKRMRHLHVHLLDLTQTNISRFTYFIAQSNPLAQKRHSHICSTTPEKSSTDWIPNPLRTVTTRAFRPLPITPVSPCPSSLPPSAFTTRVFSPPVRPSPPPPKTPVYAVAPSTACISSLALCARCVVKRRPTNETDATFFSPFSNIIISITSPFQHPFASMQPLRPPDLPNLLAFHRPPLAASLHCPPPLTPTTPPPNDQYPCAGPSPQRPPPSPVPRSPHAPTSVLTLCSPPSHSLDAPPIPPNRTIALPSPHPASSQQHSSYEANSNPSATSPSTAQTPPTAVSQATPKRRRTTPTRLARSSASRSTPTSRTKKPRTSSSKYAHGLKDFTTTVARKLRFYGSASYTSVADELVGDAITRLRAENLPFNEAEVDKNVRRRVYDALNVFSSMGFVDRNGKTVVWKGKEGFLRMVGMSGCGCREGRHTCAVAHVATQKRQNNELKTKLREKRARLEELRHQEEFVQWIVRRNASKDGSRITTGNDVRVGDDLEFKRPDSNRVDLPFIMVSAAPGTSVSVEMEDGRESIVLDFDRAFRLWDGYSIAGRVVQRGHGCGGILYDGVLQQNQHSATWGHNSEG